MLLVAKRTTQRINWEEPPVMGRKNSMGSVKEALAISGHRVDKSRITLPPISMWLREKGYAAPPIEPVPEKNDDED